MSDTITGTDQTQPDTGAQASEEARIWAELDAADAASGDDRNPGVGGDGDGFETPTNEQISDSGDGGRSPHATDGSASQAQPGKGADGQAGTATTATDPWANAPAEFRKLYEDEIAVWRGRVAGQDRKIGQLNARLLASPSGQSAPAKAGGGTAAGGAGTGGTKPTALDDDPDLKKLTEDFPEIAAPIRKVLEASEANVRTVQQQLGAMQAGEREAILTANEDWIVGEHPDFVQVATSPQFKAWAQDLSPDLKAILDRNGKRIVDPQGADAMMKLFKMQHAASAGARPGAATTQQGGGTGPSISGKRTRQMESSSAGHHGGGPRVTTEPPGEMTEQQAWEFYEREEERARRRAG